MDDRRVFEGIQTATVLKPGDKVLLTVDHHWTLQELDQAEAVLKERFADIEFIWVTSVGSVMLAPTSCACGGDKAMLRERPSGAWEMLGCTCHQSRGPVEEPTDG